MRVLPSKETREEETDNERGGGWAKNEREKLLPSKGGHAGMLATYHKRGNGLARSRTRRGGKRAKEEEDDPARRKQETD